MFYYTTLPGVPMLTQNINWAEAALLARWLWNIHNISCSYESFLSGACPDKPLLVCFSIFWLLYYLPIFIPHALTLSQLAWVRTLAWRLLRMKAASLSICFWPELMWFILKLLWKSDGSTAKSSEFSCSSVESIPAFSSLSDPLESAELDWKSWERACSWEISSTFTGGWKCQVNGTGQPYLQYFGTSSSGPCLTFPHVSES